MKPEITYKVFTTIREAEIKRVPGVRFVLVRNSKDAISDRHLLYMDEILDRNEDGWFFVKTRHFPDLLHKPLSVKTLLSVGMPPEIFTPRELVESVVLL